MPSQTTGATGIAGRYATALFELAEREKALDAVAGDLRALRQMKAESADLNRLIVSPIIGRDEQAKAVVALADAAKFSALTRNTLGVMAQNRRLFAIDGVISEFLARLSDSRGEMTAEVTSATPLNDSQRKAVEEALRQSMGVKVAVETKVDSSLLGGLVVRVGSRMVDSSLRTKLQKLQLAMKGIG